MIYNGRKHRMNEVNEKIEPKEVVKGNSDDFVKKAEAADKKPVAKRIIKTANKKHVAKTENKPGSDKNESPKVKKPLTRAQIAVNTCDILDAFKSFFIQLKI